MTNRKGPDYEKLVADHMAKRLGDERIERRAKNGKNDRGDIAGLFVRGKRCVVEVKNCVQLALSSWIGQAETERANDDAEFGVVVHHRKGFGAAKVGGSYVTMTLDTFLAIVAGGFDNLEG